MAETRTMWYAKTLGLVVLAAVLISLLSVWIQEMIWGRSNGAVGGGAAAGVAVAIIMSRRKEYPGHQETQSKS